MNYHKCARLFAVLSVAALAAASLSIIAIADDSSADDPVYVDNFSDLKDALKRGEHLTIVTASITLKESLLILDGQRVIVRDKCTLTIPKDCEICNYGHLMIAGNIVNKGTILLDGDSPNQLIFDNGTLQGTLQLNLPEITVVPTGSNEFQFPYQTGVNEDVVNITVKTYSADPGQYTFDTKLSEGKFTTSYDNGDLKYSCETHMAGKFTIKSTAPPEGFDTVSTFEELKTYLANNPEGYVEVVDSFEVTEAITIAKGQSVDLMPDCTMTITSGTIYNEGAFSNQGKLVTNGHFYQKQYRYAAYYEFGTTEGKVGLSYDDIDYMYLGADEYDIRVFPTYDIYHPIVLKCTPHDKEGTSFTYTDKAEPGEGEYTIEITNNTSSFDYFIHDAGKLNLDKELSVPPSDKNPTNLYFVVAVVGIIAAVILVGCIFKH